MIPLQLFWIAALVTQARASDAADKEACGAEWTSLLQLEVTSSISGSEHGQAPVKLPHASRQGIDHNVHLAPSSTSSRFKKGAHIGALFLLEPDAQKVSFNDKSVGKIILYTLSRWPRFTDSYLEPWLSMFISVVTFVLVATCCASCMSLRQSTKKRWDLRALEPDPLETMGLSSKEPVIAHHKRPNVAVPLCRPLIVPDGNQLVCVIQNSIRREKQSVLFDVLGEKSCGAPPLFRIAVSELGREPGIMIETLDGMTQMAFLSTEELWDESKSPDADCTLNIYRPKSKTQPKGDIHCSVSKNPDGGYHVVRGSTCLLTISGNFGDHDIRIRTPQGQHVASAGSSPLDGYQVTVESNIDAGLIVLALVAIDKCVQ